MVQLSHLYMTTGKTIALTIWTFVRKVMSLLFNNLSRLVIAFLPRSKVMKCSFGISDFLEEISGLSHSVVFLYFFALITEEGFLKSLLSCPTLCNPMDCNPPDSSVYGSLQARVLEWVAMRFFRDLAHQGIKHMSLKSPALIGRFFTTSIT